MPTKSLQTLFFFHYGPQHQAEKWSKRTANYLSLKLLISTTTLLHPPSPRTVETNFWTILSVRNEQRCCSAAEWLQEALQKSCKRAGLQEPQILAAVESPLTAINSAFAAVQKIPEWRSALQSGCKVASKRQGMLLPVMAYHSVVQKKRNAGSNSTIVMIHGRGGMLLK